MLSTTTEYALRIMITLTEAPEGVMTSGKIARIAQVPTDYAVKVLQTLGRAGLLQAQRGRGGGFRLTCDVSKTSLLEVVNAIEPIDRIRSCPMEVEAHQDGLCPLHRCLDEIGSQLEDRLRAITLENVVSEAGGSALCRPDDLEAPIGKKGRRPSRANVLASNQEEQSQS